MTAMSTPSTKSWPTSLPLVRETGGPYLNPSFWRSQNTGSAWQPWDGHPPRWQGDHFHPVGSRRHALFRDAGQTQCHSIPIAHIPAQFNEFYR